MASAVKSQVKLDRKRRPQSIPIWEKKAMMRRHRAAAIASLPPKENMALAKANDMRLKRDVWQWNANRDNAANLIAEGRMSYKQISEVTGLSVSRLKMWMASKGEFVKRVDHYIEQWAKRFMTQGIAAKHNRCRILQEMSDKMLEVVRQRQAKYTGFKSPGVDTGIMVRTVKAVGHGAKTKIVRGWDVDHSLIREIRETSKMMAQEVGDWSEKTENTNTVLVREYGGVDTTKI